MPTVARGIKKQKEILVQSMEEEYSYVRNHFKELAQYYIPQRYRALDEGKRISNKERNKYILDSHSTGAARTLASGMLFGATNPTHEWLRLSVDDESVEAKRWSDYVVKTFLQLLRRTNLYNSLAACYLDLGVFGTSAVLIYEDAETLFRGYTLPAGEYRVMKDERGKISYLSRKFSYTVDQCVRRFGMENVSEHTRRQYENPQNNKFSEITVYHLIEPNIPSELPPQFAFREYYWEANGEANMMLSVAGYYEKPFIAPRWEVVGNSTYGVSPGMDALPDVIQLQQMTRKKAIGLDKQVSPPIVVDAALRNQTTALMPNGITYVPNGSQVGAKSVYDLNLPYRELQEDRVEVKNSISRAFYNDLFRTILDLRTVRSATEIQEAVAEKLVLLGPVINRIEDEALADLVKRILGIMARLGLVPPPPFESRLEIGYDSILAAAQKAAGINNLERFMAAVGQIAPVAPETLHVVNFEETIREYGNRLNIPGETVRTREEVAARLQQEQEAAQLQQAAETGATLAQAVEGLTNAEATGRA